MQFIHDYWIGVVTCMIFCVFLLWAIGYIANGFYGYHFELQSCWTGLSTVGSAGFLAAIKYLIDSMLNTARGTKPTNQQNADKGLPK
jgi:hypothetical protein